MRRLCACASLLALVACGRGPAPPQAHSRAASRDLAIVQVEPPAGMRWRPLTDRRFAVTASRRTRGGYLTNGLLQCFVCHSERDWSAPGAPPLPSRKGAGLVWRDDGKTRLVAPNLTPDEETGTGRWSDDMLARAIREGVGHDGRLLHPAMWYRAFRGLSDEDLASVVVYLRSLPPVRNPLPQTVLSADELAHLAGQPRPITTPVPEPDLSSDVARGRYLARVADCSGCHTAWEAPRMPGIFGGGNLIERGGHHAYSSNITPDRSGVAYDANGFIIVVRTGKGGTLSPVMPWIVFRNLDDADLRALHAFLGTLHPVQHFVDNLAPPTHCVVCGQEHGLGDMNHIAPVRGIAVDPRLFDALTGTYRNEDADWTLHVTRKGRRLMAGDGEHPATELVPLSPTLYVMEGGVAPLRFERDADGKVTRLVSEEGDDLVLQRVAP